MATLVSVNVGTPTVQPGSSDVTGIVKVPRSGPVLIDTEGVVGDVIMDKQHHGGPDQAIYLYLTSDYDWWMQELGTLIEPGTFGENFTIAGVHGADLAIGDRFAIGEVLIEVSYHRTPCATFARRMGDARWVKRFQRARRPGAYARVLEAGIVEAGMAAEYVPFPGERVTVAELMSHDGNSALPTELVRRALATPIRTKTRAKYEAALEATPLP